MCTHRCSLFQTPDRNLKCVSECVHGGEHRPSDPECSRPSVDHPRYGAFGTSPKPLGRRAVRNPPSLRRRVGISDEPTNWKWPKFCQMTDYSRQPERTRRTLLTVL